MGHNRWGKWIRLVALAAAVAVVPAMGAGTARASSPDCGTGADVDVVPVALPYSCAGRFDSYDDIDSFTFDVPEGRRARAWMDIGNLQGYALTLTSPTGQKLTNVDDAEVISTTEAGTWRLDVDGDGDTVDYVVHIAEIGAPAPPVLSLSYDPVAHQGDAHPINMTAVDPNGETLRYTVEWAPDKHGIYPLYNRARSGETVVAYRKLMELDDSTFTVTVTNADGLSDSETGTLRVKPHDDCGFGPVYDAPPTHADSRVISAPCVGTMGYGLPEYTPYIDKADAYGTDIECLAHELCKVRATLTTSPGLAASITLDNYLLGEHTSRCGVRGCTTWVETVGPTYPHSSFPRLTVGLVRGKGTYTLTVEKVPIA